MHLSRFASGIRRGVKVRQQQVIGYVGSTGLATGPHLHYGITARGRHIDPLRFRIDKGALLPRPERIRFLDQLPERMSELEEIAVD
jgi:murein DD-endopeptidase MepM/ murein hydrolase activator NlpD